jgi:hypothetical protein
VKQSKNHNQKNHSMCSPSAISAATKPLALRIPEAVRVSGLSRSRLYILAGAGELIFLKCGKATLVEFASLEAAMSRLPKTGVKAAA